MRSIANTLSKGILTVTLLGTNDACIALVQIPYTRDKLPVKCEPGNCFYVDGVNGSDSNDGTTQQTAWRTLQYANGRIPGGATVLVADGVYTTALPTPGTLFITKSGTPQSWTTFAALPGHHPVVKVSPGQTLGVGANNAHHVLVDGFEVYGPAESQTYEGAAAGNQGSRLYNEQCMAVGGLTGTGTRDVIIRNSELHHCPGAAIISTVSDAVFILDNWIHDNGWWTSSGVNAIDIWRQTDLGSADTGGYRSYIVGNLLERNRNYFPWAGGPFPTTICDAPGIVVDVNDHSGSPSPAPWDLPGVPYMGRTYIANNVIRDQGMQAIVVFESAHVDVVNNTTYNNSLTDSWCANGEIKVDKSSDVNLLNNVAITLNGKQAVWASAGTLDFNVWNGTHTIPTQLGPHDIAADAHLTAPAQGDFAPKIPSPAIGNGMNSLAPAIDFFRNPRNPSRIDRGAIQVSPPPVMPAGSPYSRTYVQKAYVAYYGRAADPAGLNYWAERMDAEEQSLASIIGAFGNSDEFNRRYGGLSYSDLVAKIYQQTLGRNPDPAGLAYYVGELQAGRRTLQSITLDVLNGATTAPDSTVVANKLNVAAYYTAQVSAGCPYGTEQDGVNMISAVTASAATVTAAKATIDGRCGS